MFSEDFEHYQNLLLNNKNIELTVRWYDDFGSVEVTDFSKEEKFQVVHITELSAEDAYDVIFNEGGVSFVIDEDIEELFNELRDIQKKHFEEIGDNEERPFVNGVSIYNQDMGEYIYF